ncbi:MAG: class I SAM-dependent RNA methyltransferase [Pyrinomonadaceae bacterium]
MKSRRQAPRRKAAAEGDGRLRAGALLDVRVERILPGGVGLAHAEGQTLFVSLAAPGDLARVRVDSTKGRAAFASIVEVLEASSSRAEPPCPYFGRCGGCDFQQLTYEAQLAAKAEIIRDCLRRVAHTEPPSEIEVVPSPEVWRYRSRARWQHDPVRRHLGYYERGSHHICDVAECPVAAPPVAARLARLRELMSEGSLPQEPEFEAVAGDEGVALKPAVDPVDEFEQVRRIGVESYHFDAGCFFQINHALLEPLVAEGLRGTTEGGDIALDLYSGVGLFTLPLARRFKQVIAVEGNSASARYARRNLSGASLDNARVETSAVGDWLTRHAAELGHADFVLLDPPRAGAEPEALRAINALKPTHISYVSCDPATLARDLRHLLDANYYIHSLRAFDMFPQTHHVETVVHLFAGPVSEDTEVNKTITS